MKLFLSILLSCTVLVVFGQSKQEIEVLAKSRLLQKTVFGSKDSATLVELLSKDLSYGHSGGKVETMEETVHNVSTNRSSYTDTSMKSYNVTMGDDVAIVRFKMYETETRDGKSTPLNLAIMLVWVKEKGKWKLLARQAVHI